jgi:hypothetical protein
MNSASAARPMLDGDTSENKWLDGAMQSTMDLNCYTGYANAITTEFVGYWGNEDVTSPRVGDVYYGRVGVGGVGNPCAGPYAHIEVILPPYTFFAIDEENKVVCAAATIEEWNFEQLPDDECPQKPLYKGQFGWTFDRPGGEPWDVRDGKIVVVAFPLVSTRPLKGIAGNHYLTGAVQALTGSIDPWDDPNQGVFVAENPPTIEYDKQAAVTNLTANKATTNAVVLNHYTAGKVIFELGTTKKYGAPGETVYLKGDANAYNVYQNWKDLKPNTTYHWRVRFIAEDGRTYTGADRTFKTKSR